MFFISNGVTFRQFDTIAYCEWYRNHVTLEFKQKFVTP